MFKKILLILVAFNVLTHLSSAAANDAELLAKKLGGLDTLAGKFKQTLSDDKGDILQDSSGDFTLQRPGYFHWETKEPFPQLLVTNLKNIWLYDPDLEQVTVRQYTEAVAQTPALLLSGDVSKIESQYHVKKQSDARFILMPKLADELFVELVVEFSGEELSAMHLKDSLDQTTIFAFFDTRYNHEVSKEMFEFTPPEGTDIIIGN